MKLVEDVRPSSLSPVRDKSELITFTAVLGPMVYAAAYCPKSFKAELESMGFDGQSPLLPDSSTSS